MDYDDRVQADLEEAIADYRGETGAANLARIILERDTSIYWLWVSSTTARRRSTGAVGR